MLQGVRSLISLLVLSLAVRPQCKINVSYHLKLSELFDVLHPVQSLNYIFEVCVFNLRISESQVVLRVLICITQVSTLDLN